VAWLSVGRNVLSPYWLAAPISAFAGLLLYHGRVIADRRRADRAVVFYQDGVARLEDRWAGRGVSGDRFLDRSHAYARDLDLFGDGSLFQLLCTARTPSASVLWPGGCVARPHHPRSPPVRKRWASCATSSTCVRNSR